jgi:putative DNA primase/helicase
MTSANQLPLAELRQQFLDFIVKTIGVGPAEIIADGNIHSFSTNGKPSDRAGRYQLHLDSIPTGWCRDWRNGGEEYKWHLRGNHQRLTKDERDQIRQRVAEREAEKARLQEEGRRKAIAIWNEAEDAPNDHPYLKRKRIQPHGLRVGRDGRLIVPVTISQEMVSVQFIAENGDKLFLEGGRTQGGYWAIGVGGTISGPLCIAEGFATAATIHEATGCGVIIAFSAGNLLRVAKDLRERLPSTRFILCADNDLDSEAKGKGNPGLDAARKAARAVSELVAVPDFGPDRQYRDTDFNDLSRRRGPEGPEAVREAIKNAQAPPPMDGNPPKPNGAASPNKDPRNGAAATGTSADDYTASEGPRAEGPSASNEIWPVPQPVVTAMEPSDYPLNALPPRIKAAVEEVAGFVKAPISLVASSALSILSTVGQAYADVARADRLTGPASLFMLTIADSGERKTTCDDFFARQLKDYEEVQADLAKPEKQRYKAELDAWSAERDGILISIRKLSSKGQSVNSLRDRLERLEQEQPKQPRVPQLIHGDDTTESLAYSLAHEWPSVGILTSEAGTVLGGHAMGTDSLMRNLSQKNVLWDGGDLRVGRRTSESFTVRGARLTMGLQVQEVTLRTFFDKSKGLARGSGWLARFLITWPRSTQGRRPYGDPPPGWPQLTAFNKRIAEILEMPVPIDNNGRLTPKMLTLGKEGKKAWTTFHDAIEEELSTGGGFSNVRDVASKTADNAARISALFHLFKHGNGGSISEECFDGASKIAAFHLNESRRFFGELALPPELANALRLDAWLIDYCQRKETMIVPRREVQQFGPHGNLREKAVLGAALRELMAAHRVRITKDGRRTGIHVNPALLGAGGPS